MASVAEAFLRLRVDPAAIRKDTEAGLASVNTTAAGKLAGSKWLAGFKAVAIGTAAIGAIIVAGLAGAVKAAEGLNLAGLQTAAKNAGVAWGQFYPQAEKAGAAMEKLGFTQSDVNSTLQKALTVTGSASVSLNALGTIADYARYKHVGLSDAMQVLTTAAAGNTRALRTLGISTTDLPKNFAKTGDSASRMTTVLDLMNKKIGGTAAAWANTFPGKLAVMKAQFEGVAERVGQAVIPILSQLLTVVSSYLMPALESFSTWMTRKGVPMLATFAKSAMPVVIKAVQLFATGVSTIIKGLSMLPGPVRIAIAALAGLGIALWAISANPIMAIIAAVILLVGATVRYWPQITAAFDKAWKAVYSNFVGPMIRFFTVDIPGAWSVTVNALSGAWDSVISFFNGLYMTITAPFRQVIDWVTGTFDTWWAANGEAVKQIWSVAWNALVTVVTAVWDAVTAVIRAGWSVVTGIFTVSWAVIQAIWQVGWAVLSAAAQVAWTVIQVIFSTAWSVITSAFQIGWAVLTGIVQVAWAVIQAVIKTAWDIIVGIFTVAINLLTGHWSAAWTAIEATARQIWNNISALFSSVLNTMVSTLTTILSTIVGFFAGLGARILGALGDVGSILLNAGKGIVTGLFDGIKAVWNDVVGWFAGLPSKILSALGIASPPQWAIDAGKHIMNGILGSLTHGAADVKNFFVGLATSVTGPLKSIWGSIASAGKSLWDAVFGGGTTGGGTVQALMQSMAAARGWTGAQWTALNAVELAEAGYNMQAVNPSSGAYGLAQGITGPSWYAQYGGDAGTAAGQITAMLNYIAGRYGNPAAAWAHEQAFNWYSAGTRSARRGWAVVGERGPEPVWFHGGETVLPSSFMSRYATGAYDPALLGGGEQLDTLAGLLKLLVARTDKLIDTTASVPAGVGKSVGGALGGAAHDANFRARYSGSGW